MAGLPLVDEIHVNPEAPVQRQLEAYNARDLRRFLAEYTEDVQVFRPPNAEPALSGKQALGEYYAANRFNLPDLHAEVVSRLVMGNKVVDHERITGVRAQTFEAVAVYEVADGLIRRVWFFNADAENGRGGDCSVSVAAV